VVTVSSANNYNGPTFIQNGATLIANNATATGLGIVNVANGGTLQAGTADNILTLTTGGFALSNGAHIKVYVDHIDITGLTSFVTWTESPIMISVTPQVLLTARSSHLVLLMYRGVTAGGITIDVYSIQMRTPLDCSVSSVLRLQVPRIWFDCKLVLVQVLISLICSLLILTNLKYADGTDSVKRSIRRS
jgi:hypothetical protein